MKRFIAKVVLLSLPIILLMYIADYCISYNLKNNSEYPGEIEVWNDIYNEDINSDIAVYGSSRAWTHINSNILEDSLNIKAYNFGMDGHNFWLQYLRHIEYLKHNKPPKVIILSVDIYSLAKRKNLYELNQFLPYMLWNNNIVEFTSSYNGFSFVDYYFPLFRYYGKMRGTKSVITLYPNKNNKNLYRYKGYKGIEKKWNNDLAKAKLKMDQYSVNIDSSTVNLFDQFLLECQSNKITVVLVYTPEHVDGQVFVENREEVINIFNDFSNKYNLLFLDYSNDELCKQKNFFYNTSHLNKKGSEIFTRKLSNDLSNSIYKK